MITYFKENIEIYIILVGTYESKLIASINEFLKNNKDTLLICNTDLTHCGPNYKIACQLNHIQFDKLTIRKLSNLVFDKKFNMCGKEAVKTYISICRKNKYIGMKKHYNNSNSKPNYVGYPYIIYFSFDKMNITRILKLPRICLFGKSYTVTSPIIWKKAYSVFVTINKKKQLRGCIGGFTPDKNVEQLVATKTKDSAFNDSRFSPIKLNEWKYLSFKINFLETPFEVSYPDEFRKKFILGLHGITVYFRKESQNTSATYLASVMTTFMKTKIKSKLELVINKLRKKSGADDTFELYKCELYKCSEYSEHDTKKFIKFVEENTLI